MPEQELALTARTSPPADSFARQNRPLPGNGSAELSAPPDAVQTSRSSKVITERIVQWNPEKIAKVA
jgi:hypothetical protein